MRYLVLIVGLLLSLLGGLKVYAVFHNPDVGPELMADATLLVLGAVVCFAIFAKMGRRKVKRASGRLPTRPEARRPGSDNFRIAFPLAVWAREAALRRP